MNKTAGEEEEDTTSTAATATISSTTMPSIISTATTTTSTPATTPTITEATTTTTTPAVEKSDSTPQQQHHTTTHHHPKDYECICGKEECRGITSAFFLLKDTRSGFTKLPPSVHDKKGDIETHQLREAYLRHLNIKDEIQNDEEEEEENEMLETKQEEGNGKKKKKKKLYVANHHFHPELVNKAVYNEKTGRYKLPVFITAKEMIQMNLNLSEEDRFHDNGFFGSSKSKKRQSYYYAVPNYTFEESHSQLRKTVRAQQIMKETERHNKKLKKRLLRQKVKEMKLVEEANKQQHEHEKEEKEGKGEGEASSDGVVVASSSPMLGNLSRSTSGGDDKNDEDLLPSSPTTTDSTTGRNREFSNKLQNIMDTDDSDGIFDDDNNNDIGDDGSSTANDSSNQQQQQQQDDDANAVVEAVDDTISSSSPAGEETQEKHGGEEVEDNKSKEERQINNLIHNITSSSSNDDDDDYNDNDFSKDQDGLFIGNIDDGKNDGGNGNDNEKITFPTKLLPPSSYEIENEMCNINSYEDMVQFETKRKSIYTDLFQLVNEEYNNSTSLLHQRLSDLILVERIIVGTSHANEIYANMMNRIYKDVYLDEFNNPIHHQGETTTTKNGGGNRISSLFNSISGLANEIGGSVVGDSSNSSNSGGRQRSEDDESAKLVDKTSNNTVPTTTSKSEDTAATDTNNSDEQDKKNYYKTLMTKSDDNKTNQIPSLQNSDSLDNDNNNNVDYDAALSYDRMKEQHDSRFASKIKAGQKQQEEDYDDQQQQQYQHSSPLPSGSKNRNSAIGLLLNSTNTLCRGFHDNSIESQRVANSIQITRRHTHKQICKIEHMGKQMLSQMNKIEKLIQNTWNVYDNKGDTSPSPSPPPTSASSPMMGEDEDEVNSNYTESTDNSDNTNKSTNDRWLAETHYRTAVVYQANVWKTSFTDLWHLMTKTERELRRFLQEQLVDYVPRQKRLFSMISSEQTPILEQLLDRIRIHDDDADDNDSSTGDTQDSAQSLISGEALTPLESLTTSPLFSSSKVVQRNVKVGFRGECWKNTLSVLTTDLYMHLFDLPDGPMPSENQAFSELIPSTFHLPAKLGAASSDDNRSSNSSTTNGGVNLKNGDLSNKTKFFKSLIPFKSYYLPDCAVSLGSDQRDIFEITEEHVDSNNNGTVFGAPHRKNTCVYRTCSVEETAFWIATLDHLLLSKFQQQH